MKNNKTWQTLTLTLLTAVLTLLSLSAHSHAQTFLADFETGQKELRTLEEKFGWVTEEKIVKRVEQVFGNVGRAANMDFTKTRIFIAQSREVNALTLPGGYIVLL